MTSGAHRGLNGMTRVTAQISVSLDGFAAGPNQSFDDPLGEGGMQLHQWAFAAEAWRSAHGLEGGERNTDSEMLERLMEPVRAQVMGRRMFGGGEGAWDLGWQGWWGDDPPFHCPVFVLTHHPREPLTLSDTTFTFVTGGIEDSVGQARAAAGDGDVQVSGGASTVAQALAAGLVDELTLHVVPVLLRDGVRPLDGAGDPELEAIEVVPGSGVTHLRYRVTR